MAVTRINNNQITDASAGNVYLGINANTKIQNYSITANKIANSLVYGSDLTVTGNLTVQGNTTAIDTTITTIEDPVIVLASTQTGSPTVDIGFIGQRGTSENIAFVWNEANAEFVTAFTSTAETSTTVSITGYADLHTANATIGGNAVITGTTSLTGNIIGDANVTGNVTGGNLLTAGSISATGNITTPNYFVGNLVGTTVSATGNITGGNIISGNAVIGNINVSGDITVNSLTSNTTVSAGGTVTGGNIATGGTVSATGTGTFGNVATSGTVSATSTITGGNIATGGTVSATSTITGGNIATGGTVSATGTGTFGNVDTGGTVSATGNITGANLFTGGTASASGNVTGGNILTGGLVSATGTITGGNLETGGTANVTNTITGGNLSTGGFLSVVGTATVGNLDTAGTVSATGNGTFGNIGTAGIVSSTGTITGGNLETGGAVSSTGNVTGGNILTGGLVSATGNITGGNLNAPQVYGSTTLTLVAGTGNINLDTTGNIVLANTFINGVAYPAQDQDAASKIYVDNLVTTAISYHEAVVAATNTTLDTATGGTITYAQPNGAANGIGATLTTTGTFTTIDTANVQTVGTRILVKDQANAVQNGIYVWSNATVITRASDEDTYGPATANALSINDYFFVTNGNVNAGSAWIVDAPNGTITFGTSNIQFAQFSQSQVYSANTAAGISLVGTVFSAKIDNNTTAFDGSGNISVKAGANLTTPNIGAATGTSLSVTGAVTAGNIATSGTVSATSTITGGNIDTGGTISATSTITGGNIATAGTVSATGTGTFGNVGTGGTVSATGNITGANIVTGGLITATGDVTGGNIFTGGLISSTGTITGGNLETSGTANVTNTITGGNLSTGGFLSAVGTATVGNLATAGTVSATGNVTGGNITTAGDMSATGNVYAANFFGNVSGNITSPGANTDVIFNDNGVANATAGFTFNKTTNVVTTTGAFSTLGNVYGGNIILDSGPGHQILVENGATLQITGSATVAFASTGSINGSSGDITTPGTINANSTITGGNISTAGNITGGNIVISGDDITDTNGRVNFNTAGADVDFAVNGDTVANIFYIDAGTGTASFGNATQTTNSIVSFNATNSVLMPVGNTAQRPSVGVTGMLRFNTSDNNFEVFDNSQWVAVGVPEFTLITDEQFNGTGSQTVFTLSAEATTAGTIVSINGVQQIPVTAYSVSGVTLTFTEAPEVGDLIDVRILTTTTSVTSISNAPGNAVVAVSPTVGQVNVTGNMVISGTVSASGFIGLDATKIANGTSEMAVIASGGNIRANIGGTTVMTVSTGLVGVTGNISATGDVTAQNVNSLSDATLKANVAPIENAGTVVDGLNGVGYDWQDGSGHAYGMIAQQVEEVIPEAVKTDANGIKSVNYSMVIPFLVETVKQLRQDIAEIKTQLKK
jgi:hypothetical protein